MTCLRFLSTLSTSAINSSLSRSMSDSQPSQWKLLLLLIHLIGSLTLLLHLAQVTVIRWSPIGSLGMGYHEYKRQAKILIFSLPWSGGGYRMKNERPERLPCEPGINSVQFEPPWPFCAFLVFQLERVHRRIAGALKGGERKTAWCLSFRKRAQRMLLTSSEP